MDNAEEFLLYLRFLMRRLETNLDNGDSLAVRYNITNITNALDTEISKLEQY